VHASPSFRLPSPSPKSARVLQVPVTEQPTSPDTQAPAAARHPLSLPPPVAARLITADVYCLPHRHVAMAALRFSLLVAVLLGLVLLTAPDQASAEATFLYLCVNVEDDKRTTPQDRCDWPGELNITSSTLPPAPQGQARLTHDSELPLLLTPPSPSWGAAVANLEHATSQN